MSLKNTNSWQISYIVENLIAPETPVIVNDEILIVRGEHLHQAYVFFKVTEEEKDAEGFPKKDILDEVLQIYALETLRHAQTEYWRVFIKTPINEIIPFGVRPIKRIPTRIEYNEAQLKVLYYALDLSIKERNTVKDIFSNNQKKSTQIALEYFYKSIGEGDVNKRLIDLVVALEAFFSGGQEIRYKVSLRMATLLGYIGRNKKEVFDTVYRIYNKRNQIVHGRGDIKIEWDELYRFEGYLQDCCRIFIYLEENREDIIKMLDESLLIDSISKDLSEKVINAYSSWSQSGFRELHIPLPRQTKAQMSIEFIPK